MTNIHSHPTPLRQKFIEYLTLNRKAERTVHTYVSFIYSLAKHGRRSPDLLGPEDIRQWLYYLIAERKQAASTVNLAINAVRSFYGGLLQRDIEPLLHQIKRPRRPALAPRLYSMAEVERLLTVGTAGNLRALAFLSCVYGGGLRLTFTYKDYADAGRSKALTLTGVEFLRRWRFHLLPRGFTKIRHYGLLRNNRRHRRVPQARTALATSPLRFGPAPTPRPAPPPLTCPHCQSPEVRCIGRVERSDQIRLFARPWLSGRAPAYTDTS